MDSMNNDGNGGEAVTEKKGGILASKRFILIVLITLVLLWLVWTILGFLDDRSARKAADHAATTAEETHGAGTDAEAPVVKTPSHAPKKNGTTADQDTAHTAAKSTDTHQSKVAVPTVAPVMDTGKGVAFVNACMQPMDYELNGRFWGWRPNDILNVTDNVNNFQPGRPRGDPADQRRSGREPFPHRRYRRLRAEPRIGHELFHDQSPAVLVPHRGVEIPGGAG